MPNYRDRIVEFRRIRAGDLAPDPRNWRRHPVTQQKALRDNIRRAVEFAEMADKDTPMWFDMEGRIRKDGWLDLDAVRDVCRQVWPQVA